MDGTSERTLSAPKAQESRTADVWSALCAAQEAFPALGKTAQGQRSKYAPLDEVIDKIGPVLRSHGLTSTALPFMANDYMMVRRVLFHAASQTEISLEYPVAPLGRTPQEIGSALTYARRYSLLAICDVHPTDEDDDGEKAGQAKPQAKVVAPAAQKVSAYTVREQKSYDRLLEVLAIVETEDDLENFRDVNKLKIGSLPDEWKKQLEREIMNHMVSVGVRQSTDREIERGLREHV